MEHHIYRKHAWPRLIALALLLAFWATSVWHIDRFPPIHEDEPWILSPGYKLFTRGVYGSDLFAGAFGMDDHYLQFMPLMPVIQGAVLRFLGVGVFQMRFAPLTVGVLLLALSFAVATRLIGTPGGLLAMTLLLTWQWMPTGGHILGSGIPLIDMTRIARYDLLAALLGLCAFWHFIQARTTIKLRYDLFCGLFAGLAGLAHLYGLFWGSAIFCTLLLDWLVFSQQTIRRHMACVLAGVLIVWLPWLAVLATYWNDYVYQQMIYPERFDLLNPAFYLTNLVREPYRYTRGWSNGSVLWLVGFWVLLLGVPAAAGWSAMHTFRLRERSTLWLLVIACTLPALFALLIQPKNPYHLPSIVVVLVLLIVRPLAHLLQAPRARRRMAAAVVVAVLCLQGLSGVIVMQTRATQTPPATHYLAQIRGLIPSGVRVLGLPPYWLAVPEPGYRSFNVLLLLAEPAKNPAAVSLDTALERIAPHFVLIDPNIASVLGYNTDVPNIGAREQFWTYMERHDARLIATVKDNFGAPIQIYRLHQAR